MPNSCCYSNRYSAISMVIASTPVLIKFRLVPYWSQISLAQMSYYMIYFCMQACWKISTISLAESVILLTRTYPQVKKILELYSRGMNLRLIMNFKRLHCTSEPAQVHGGQWVHCVTIATKAIFFFKIVIRL